MREWVYGRLVGLPGKIIAAVNTAAGLFGMFASERIRSEAGYAVTAETIHSVGDVLLVFSMLYFAALWLLKPTPKAHQERYRVILGALDQAVATFDPTAGTMFADHLRNHQHYEPIRHILPAKLVAKIESPQPPESESLLQMVRAERRKIAIRKGVV